VDRKTGMFTVAIVAVLVSLWSLTPSVLSLPSAHGRSWTSSPPAVVAGNSVVTTRVPDSASSTPMITLARMFSHQWFIHIAREDDAFAPPKLSAANDVSRRRALM
jgi:hypothetical protein